MQAEITPERTSIGITGQIFNLTEDDLRSLQSCFVSREIAEAARLRRASDEIGAEIVGKKRKAGFEYSGLVFPYFLPSDYSKARQYRLRRDKPDIERNGDGKEKETAKYLGAYGDRNSFYFPPNIKPEWLKDTALPVILTEGEKKALALTRLASDDSTREDWRFLPLALSGVWNFRSNNIGKATRPNGEKMNIKGLIPDFELIEWKGRDAFILFDANVRTNSDVMTARFHLAEALQSKGAIVYFVDLPQTEEINGIDDLLGKWDRESGTVEAIRRGFELIGTKYRFTSELQSVLFGGKLKLTVSAAERGKCKVSAKDAHGEIIALDTFNIFENEKRAKFIRQINLDLTAEEKTEIARALIKLAEVSGRLFESDTTAEPTGETIETSFQILKDGRVIEQIRGGFAVYDADTGEHSILETVTDSDGTTYAPIDDALFSEGGLHVADDLTDYGDETALDADIEAYLLRYADVSILHRKMTAKYIRFTYLFDKTYELPYITATGEGGNGKTRLGELVCFASRRGLTLINPSAPSLFRIIDKYQPTLFLDELNLADTGEDTMAILQVLNSGIKKTTGLVPRQEKGADGNFQTRLYRTFAPKIVGSLKKTKSQPFNSRCIEIQMEATKRNDIPFRTTSQMLEDARRLRNKLTLYRLRNFSIDFEQKLGEAEKEMKAANLKPRTTQVNTPLLALTDDEQLKADFLLLLQESDSVRAKDKLDTIDGEIAQAIHALIFDADADGNPALRNEFENIENLKPNEHLTVEKILESLNEERSEKKKISSQWLGQLLKGLKIETKKNEPRQSPNHKKREVVFDAAQFQKLFESFALTFPEIVWSQWGQAGKSININNKPDSIVFDSQNPMESAKANNNNTYAPAPIDSIVLAETNGNGKRRLVVNEVI